MLPLDTLRAHLAAPVTRKDLIIRYCTDKDVLDIGCVNHNSQNTHAPRWLHSSIKSVAKSLVGLDYLQHETSALAAAGYTVVCADITAPLSLGRTFDVIVVGNLIEHLTNFEGFWNNLHAHLSDNGIILLSTANPFFVDQYFYSAFKNDIIINPEHTCWIDPVALSQMAERFSCEIIDLYWITERWHLPQVICHGPTTQFDMLTGTWNFSRHRTSLLERLVSPFLELTGNLFKPRQLASLRSLYGQAHLRNFLYIVLKSTLFGLFWSLFTTILFSSRLTRYELYLAVIRKTRTGSSAIPNN